LLFSAEPFHGTSLTESDADLIFAPYTHDQPDEDFAPYSLPSRNSLHRAENPLLRSKVIDNESRAA
jgi:hypothetical protein